MGWRGVAAAQGDAAVRGSERGAQAKVSADAGHRRVTVAKRPAVATRTRPQKSRRRLRRRKRLRRRRGPSCRQARRLRRQGFRRRSGRQQPPELPLRRRRQEAARSLRRIGAAGSSRRRLRRRRASAGALFRRRSGGRCGSATGAAAAMWTGAVGAGAAPGICWRSITSYRMRSAVAPSPTISGCCAPPITATATAMRGAEPPAGNLIHTLCADLDDAHGNRPTRTRRASKIAR